MKLKKLVQCLALIGIASPVLAQETGSISDTSVQRVEITGSSIKRIAKEGALPVQVISAEQISKQGITSAEQLLSTISANGTGADNMTSGNNVFGADSDRVSGGASYASLRGLGPNHTLVLINGRRMSTFGASGKAVDLNSIPMAAVARVEVLKDGASAIYGTDAVGGVINFILKQNYQGLEATINDNFTQEGGGTTRRTTILAGHGDLQTDHYNLMASVTVDHNDELSSHQRSFANGFQPSRGLSPDTTGTPYANQLSGAGTALGSSFTVPGDPNKYLQAGLLSLQGKCNSYPGMMQYQTSLWKDVTSPLRSTYSCAYDYGADYVMSMPVERTNFVARGVFQLAPEHRMNVEFLGSNTKATAILTPEQISTGLATTVTLNDGSKTVINSAYPVSGPYYQNLQPYISTFDPTKPIAYKWRADPFGNRTQQNDTNGGRLLVSFEGTIADKWDYKQGFSYAASKTQTDLTDGYVLSIPMYQALGTGVINPWALPGQGQSAAAQAAINSFEYRGGLQHGKTTLAQIDGSVSGEVYQLPAGPLSMAVGYEYRRESYGFQQDVDASTILLAPGNGNQPTVFRNVAAVYAEAIVPITKQLETQLAIRTDQYSVIGRTTDPKIAFRYQPTQWLLFRGSANKGFLAPSFTQLYSGQLLEELPNGIIDPIGCPTHPGNPAYCAIDRQSYYSGGNPNLKPETSKQGTLGVVIEPFKGYSASFDWWAINTKNAILNRTPQIVLANAAALSSDIVRNADGTINYITAGWINAGGVKTRGVDVALRGEGSFSGYKWSATLDGTWTQSYKYQEIAGEPYLEEVGNFYTRDLYLRWKHNATFNVGRGNWSGTLSQRYASGYKDELPDAGVSAPPAGFNPDVHSYTTYSLYGTYTGIKNATITVGIQNLLNTDPPFTAHNVDEVVGAGWDPRVADPRGRAISFELKYKFF